MKKVLIVVPSLGIGGREKIALNMRECLGAVYDVDIVIFQNRDNEYSAGCGVINLNVPSSKSKIAKITGQIKRSARLKRIIKKEKPDIVFSLGAAANLTNALSKRGNKTKHIIAVHSFAEVKKSKKNTFMFGRADGIVTISKEMHHKLLQLYPNLKNTAVVENGYKIDDIDVSGRVYDPDAPRFVSMGRLERVKGFDRLIKSFAIIQKAIPGARLSFVGDGSDKEKLIELTKTLGIEKSVDFLGYNPEPLSVLKENDIYLLTSRNEGFPNCLIEALNCGLAVVSLDCLSGPREILSEKYDVKPVEGIRFEKYGVLVENFEDENKLIETFAKAAVELAKDEGRIEAYKQIGLPRANDFSLEVFKDKLTALFEKTLGQDGENQ